MAQGKGKILIKDSSTDDKRDFLKWDFRNGLAAVSADFGDLVSGGDSVALCVYDHSGGTPERILQCEVSGGGTCGTKPCWKTAVSGKIAFTDASGGQGGIKKIELKAGAAGKTQLMVKGLGFGLEPPAPPFAKDPEVTVQLRSSNGSCWEAHYSTAIKNEPGKFQAKAD